MACNLEHVPERLHQKDKLVIHSFDIGEEIYRRCSASELENPYKTISICELSHNRKGLNNAPAISHPDDSLINITGKGEPLYDKVVCTLVIKDLANDSGTYCKIFPQVKENITYNAKMMLIHEPVACMYPHCVFRIWLNDELITYENYNLLEKLKQIKTQLKEALAKMIIQKQISQENT